MMGLFSIGEKALTSKERNNLKDSDFGIPELRKFPLTDKEHVQSALRYFNTADNKYKKELARRINSKAKEFGIEIGDDNNIRQYLNESNTTNYKNLYFLSNTSMDGVVLNPRIPNNYFTKNGFEDNKTKRVCFAPSIDKALMALSRRFNGQKLYVHKAVNYEKLKIRKPSIKEVPDSKITGEIWVLQPVEIEYIGEIKVIKDKGLPGHKFKYGDNEAELYDWEWKWIKKFSKDGTILQEATKVNIKTTKKYKCPFCDNRLDREHLVYHVEDDHEDMIPEGYTAARVVFNHINHKERGTCIVCGGETEWKEKTWKYARLCKNPKCTKALSDKADKNMKSKLGYTAKELLKNPEHQNKMLKGRKISGTYTFKDGGKRDYVGSYEKNLLEFYDEVLNVHSSEIMSPGPVIEYKYKGEKHFWITDLYYITANLAHDVKDGGNNPNNREMKEYREKQDAKEKAIIEQGEYNYIRLTDNNFEQLLQIFSDIKMMMIDDNVENKTISRINEYTALGGMNPVVGSSGNYIVNYGINGVMTGQAYTKDKALSKIYKVEDNKIKEEKTKDFLENYDYELYKYNESVEVLDRIEELMFNENEVSDNVFYKLLTESSLLEIDQLKRDNRFSKVDSIYEYLGMVNEVISNSINEEFNEYMGSPTLSINLEAFSDIESKIIKIQSLQNENGIYIKNIETGMRSGYYNHIEDIPITIRELLK